MRHGTVTPTHYNLILDEVGMGAEKAQRLTYMMTYLYYNFPGPVRVPAPCLVSKDVCFFSREKALLVPQKC